MRILKRCLVLVLLALVLVTGVLFSMQNTAVVPLDLLVVQLAEQRVALWVLSAFVLGAVSGIAISTYTIIYLKAEVLLLRRRLAHKNKELNKLRQQDAHLPVTKSQ